MLSDAPAEDVDVLEEFGEALGLAFQLSDDIMDVAATEAELRKEPGQDMREGVYTLPVLYALADGSSGAELQGLLAAGSPQGDRLARALDLVRSDGSLRRARDVVTAGVRRARKLAGGLPAGSPRDALVHIADFVAARCGAEG